MRSLEHEQSSFWLSGSDMGAISPFAYHLVYVHTAPVILVANETETDRPYCNLQR